MTHASIALPLVPLAAALVALALPSRWAGRLALLAHAIGLALAVPLFARAAQTPSWVAIPWIPALGITASLSADRLAGFFAVLVCAIGIAIVQYARAYLGTKARSGFWAALLAFTAAMLGLVLADSLVLLVVCWEATTITSALLIGLDFEKAEARRGAIQAFVVTAVGGLALLAAVILCGIRTGAWELSALIARRDALLADPAAGAIFGLVLLAAFTKSAQFPFSFWLPGAMAAPAPISAYLHSATMVKAGIFLLARFAPVFSVLPAWGPVLVSVGLTTYVLGALAAARSRDAKELLAQSTVSSLGALVAILGVEPRVGSVGLLVQIANHAIYKSSLFLLAGWLEKATGTRDLSLLARERWSSRAPRAFALFALGAMAMAGTPLLFGFVGKELFLAAVLAYGPLATLAAVLGSALLVTASLRVALEPFLGREPPDLDRGARPAEISRWLLAIPAALLVPQLVFGLAPDLAITIVDATTPWPGGFAFFHAADLLLALSVVAFSIGFVGWWFRRRLSCLPALPALEALAGRAAQRFLAFTAWLSHALQAGGHPRFVATILAMAIIAVADALLYGRAWQVELRAGPNLAFAWIPAAAIVVGAATTLVMRRRVAKLVGMAIAGYGTALAYVLFRAPDLALTQVLIETISLVMLLLVIRKLPPLQADLRGRAQKLVHAGLAVTFGLGMGALAWLAASTDTRDPAGSAHVEAAPLAKGKNVVNLVLVDFRAADTLGEITVLAIAALGAVGMLGRFDGHRRRLEERRA